MSYHNDPTRTRHFDDCLWCSEPLTQDIVANRGNFFCNNDCYRIASRTIRMALGTRKSGGKSGIQAMLLGLLLKSLQRHPDGLTGKDMIAVTQHDYSDYSKLLNARKLSPYFRIYLQPDVYMTTPTRNTQVYQLTKGTCLKEWLKPKYTEFLEAQTVNTKPQ